jgi:hypothetical protein
MGFEPKVPKTALDIENQAAVCFSPPRCRSLELDFGFEFQQEELSNGFRFISGENDAFTIKAYADAETKGLVDRNSNTQGMSPEKYADRLFYDGKNRGWLSEKTRELKNTFPNNRLHSIAYSARSE